MYGRREFLQFTLTHAFLITAGKRFLPMIPDMGSLPPVNRVALRFAIASDGHFGQENTDFDPRHDLVIRALNQEHRGRGVDFSFINGDLFHNDPRQLIPVKQKWDALRMPWYVSHGNHDLVSEAEWKSVFGKGWQYGFEKGGCGFIVLNTATAEGEYACPDLESAKELLEEFSRHQAVFVFMHITPCKWTNGGITCPDLVSLFNRQTNLKAVFHGHDHDQEGAWQKDGIAYVFDAHVAGNWGLPYSGYRIVEVLKDGAVLTYQMNAGLGKEVNSHQLG